MSDLSRVEQLLRNALGEDIYEVTPQSRVEVLLQQLNEYIEGIGGGSIDPEVITAWLAENIHDGAVVDSSLTVEGAAADSKKTGTEISQIKEDLNVVSGVVGANAVYSDAIATANAYITIKDVYLEKGHSYKIQFSINGVVSSNLYCRVRNINEAVTLGSAQIVAGKTQTYVIKVDSEKSQTVALQTHVPTAGMIVNVSVADDDGLESLAAKNIKAIETLNSAIINRKLKVELGQWERGGIDGSGNPTSSTNDIRTENIIHLDAGKYYINPNGYGLYYFYYNESGEYIRNCSYDRKWGTTKPFYITFAERKNIKFVQAHTGITPNDNTLTVDKIPLNDASQHFANGIVIMSKNGEGLNVPPFSLYAVREVYENGYDGFRMDVCKTSDGHYVLSHDRSINAVARNSDNTDISETINIDEHTLSELNQYDFGIRYGGAFAGTQITELSDAVALCAKLGLRLDIEWKYPTMSQEDAEAIYDTIVTNGYSNKNWHWIAFNNDMVAYFKNVCDYVDIEVLVTTSGGISYYLPTIENAKSVNHNVIVGYSDGNFSDASIITLRKLNVIQNRGTASNVSEMIAQIESGVTEIECNFYNPKQALIEYALNN